MKKLLLSCLSVALFVALAAPAPAADPIRVMLLDGESAGPYHAWKLTTPVLEKVLEETGLFQVDVVTAPPSSGDFSNFNPKFSDYQVVVMNLDSPTWPDNLKASFEEYVSGGGGLVIVHGADNAFPDWVAFNEMAGIGGWRGRNENAGPYWYYKDGKLVSDTSPGNAGAHGLRLPIPVKNQVTDHPITKGLPEEWLTAPDELYDRMRGPGKNMTVLSTAYSDPENRGTGREEPILMVLSYGKGRIFHTILGHDVAALASVGFIVTYQRGTEWAATGKVTQEVPTTFPTADTVTYRQDIVKMDPSYGKPPARGPRAAKPKPQ
jgi:type 1 glutamine amidotransferase